MPQSAHRNALQDLFVGNYLQAMQVLKAHGAQDICFDRTTSSLHALVHCVIACSIARRIQAKPVEHATKSISSFSESFSVARARVYVCCNAKTIDIPPTCLHPYAQQYFSRNSQCVLVTDMRKAAFVPRTFPE